MITAQYLVEYCLAQVNRPYWTGTVGHRASESLFNQKKAQYPNDSNYKNKTWVPDYYMDKDEKVHDCCGLIKGACWCQGPNKYFTGGKEYQSNGCMDWSVDSMYRNCPKRGSISTLPNTPGTLVFNSSLGHVGVYIGNGEVVEARGRAYGVQRNKLKDRPGFTLWGQLKCIDYGSEPVPPTPTVDYVAKIKEFQKWLNSTYGDHLAIDGDFGAYTMRPAIRSIQTELNKLGENLAVDSQFGPKSQAALSRHMVKRGTKGNMAYNIQGCLYGRKYDCNGFDGSVGSGCEAAIKRYQFANGLEVDGKVGGLTYAKMVEY